MDTPRDYTTDDFIDDMTVGEDASRHAYDLAKLAFGHLMEFESGANTKVKTTQLQPVYALLTGIMALTKGDE